jgi:hypothetical protein
VDNVGIGRGGNVERFHFKESEQRAASSEQEREMALKEKNEKVI